MAKHHMVLMGKGGVGKTTTSVFLAQYYQEKGWASKNIDTDQVNASFKAFRGLNVSSLDIMVNNEISARGWDSLVEQLYRSEIDTIVDNGATSFISLLAYMMENNLPELLASAGHEVYFHIVIAGGEGLGHCLNGMDRIIEQFQDSPAKYVIWLNNFLGPIEMNGGELTTFPEYKKWASKITAIIEPPAYTSATFGQDISYMLSNNYTFAEMLSGEHGTSIASLNRYKSIKNDIFQLLNMANIFEPSADEPAKKKK